MAPTNKTKRKRQQRAARSTKKVRGVFVGFVNLVLETKPINRAFLGVRPSGSRLLPYTASTNS